MLDSNSILAIVKDGLEEIGYQVENGKSKQDAVAVPVLYGLNGKPEKQFFADAYHRHDEIVLEVEAAAAVINNLVLKDLFEALEAFEKGNPEEIVLSENKAARKYIDKFEEFAFKAELKETIVKNFNNVKLFIPNSLNVSISLFS